MPRMTDITTHVARSVKALFDHQQAIMESERAMNRNSFERSALSFFMAGRHRQLEGCA